jgi:hypothetical protein
MHLEDEDTFENQGFGWYIRRGVILTKITLQNATGMDIQNVYSVTKRRQ